jgi:hypothetical protein
MIKSEEKIDKALATFRSLDLSEYPIEDIKGLIVELGAIPTPLYTLHPGKVVVRARLNKKGDPFTERKRVSYVPAKYNEEFQRASTPDQNMFYGAIISENLDKEELQNERITTAYETSKLVRKTTEQVETEVLTFSRWLVTKDIPLVAIIDPTERKNNKIKVAQELYDMFWEFIKKDEEKLSPTVKSAEFFANEFSKEIAHDAPDYNYLISAIFSNNIVNGGTAGVIYPSVKTSAKSLNVAISPEFVENCMELDSVLHCKMYKLKNYSIVNNELIATNIDNSQDFTYEAIDSDYNLTEEEIIKQLGSAT